MVTFAAAMDAQRRGSAADADRSSTDRRSSDSRRRRRSWSPTLPPPPVISTGAGVTVVLCKSMRLISQVVLLPSDGLLTSPVRLPRDFLNINRDFAPATYFPLSALPCLRVRADWREPFEKKEWFRLLEYLCRSNKVGICDSNGVEFLIVPPRSDSATELDICYRPAGAGAGAVGRIRNPPNPRPFDSDRVFAPHRGGNQSPNLVYRRDDFARSGDQRRYFLHQNEVPHRFVSPVAVAAMHEPDGGGRSSLSEKQFIWTSAEAQNPKPAQDRKPLIKREAETIAQAPVVGAPETRPKPKEAAEAQDARAAAAESTHATAERSAAEATGAKSPTPRRRSSPATKMRSSTPRRKQKEEDEEEREGEGEGEGQPINPSRIHPSYLETISEMHSKWVFGAVAEFIDNSRDAGARKVEVTIRSEYYHRQKCQIPVLKIEDDGSGMTHEAMVKMLTLGCASKRNSGKDMIGRYGVGFKTGAMRLGRDALVLTQSSHSRSVALLSRSFNEDKEQAEIPMLYYVRHGHHMDFDLAHQSRRTAQRNLAVVKEFSPFNEYSLGQQFLSLGEQGTGTKIFIYNLDTWGDNFTLDWDDLEDTGIKRKDIRIRSRRKQCRPGQLSEDVPLDYSLQAYLEVVFIFPRMKMFVQGSQVKVRPLAKSLQQPRVFKDKVLGRQLLLTLGMVERERKLRNSGVFLYWRGRLIEAYKRVGGMLHSADMGRGVLGVVDVTDLMVDRDGRPLVLNNKQGFKECEEYAMLEHWLGTKADFYCDEVVDPMKTDDATESVELIRENDWVRCDKCLKWRMLPLNVDASALPELWLCQMEPFKGNCNIPEQRQAEDVRTIAVSRSHAPEPGVAGSSGGGILGSKIMDSEAAAAARNRSCSSAKDKVEEEDGGFRTKRRLKRKKSQQQRILEDEDEERLRELLMDDEFRQEGQNEHHRQTQQQSAEEEPTDTIGFGRYPKRHRIQRSDYFHK